MAAIEARVAAVRRFNRFYTRRIGALQFSVQGSPYSLTEARVLYELAHLARPTAAGVRRELGLDAGYLSRILSGFRKRGLIAGRASGEDARLTLLKLTAAGRRTFATLQRRTDSEIAALLGRIPPAKQRRAVAAMRELQDLLDDAAPQGPAFELRAHRPGDIGWVISAHGSLYAQEFGWDASFEAMVADIAAGFVRKFDAARERCWIAEMDGEPVGSVFLVRKSKTVAKLRLLIVDPRARGHGLGRRLVEACIAQAREFGYRELSLWTQSSLLAARRIYADTGFRLVRSEPHRSFGTDLVGEYWERDL